MRQEGQVFLSHFLNKKILKKHNKNETKRPVPLVSAFPIF